MPEIDRLNDSTDWIDVEFVQGERTPERIIEVVFSCIWLGYHFRIPNSILRGWVSNGVGQQFTTGYRRPTYSRPVTPK